MTICRYLIASCLVFLSTGAALGDGILSGMDGAWRGGGWARSAKDAPRERVRCRIENIYDASADSLSVDGACAAPGQKVQLKGLLAGIDGSERVEGRWYNPTGAGSTEISGERVSDSVFFSVYTRDPEAGRQVSQIVRWSLIEGTLTLSTSDAGNRSEILSVIVFTK